MGLITIDENENGAPKKTGKAKGTVHDNVSAPEQDQAANAAAGASSTTKAPDTFLSIVLNTSAARRLQKEGEDYLNRLQETCDSYGIEHKLLPSTNAHIFYKDKKSIAICFYEHVQDLANNQSIVRVFERVATEFGKNHDPKMGVLVESIVVHPSDYPFVGNMADAIRSALEYSINENVIFDYVKAGKYRINTNLHTVQAELRKMSPHGVPNRVEFGLVLEILDTTNVDTNRRNVFMNDRDAEYKTVAAIGGYTDIIKVPGSRRMEERFQPLIHITDIQSPIRTARLLPLLLVLAGDAFYTNNMWMSQFMSFTANNPNLGTLVNDPSTGAPDFLQNSEQLRNFIAEMCEDPLMILDIQPGRFTLPGMYLLTDENYQRYLIADIANFFNSPQLADSYNLTERPVEVITGFVEANGQLIDSRYIDYFALISSSVQDRGLLEQFLTYADRPDLRMEAIRTAGYRQCEPIYTTFMSLINADGWAALASHIVGTMDIQLDYYEVPTSFSGGLLAERSRQFREVVSRQGSIVSPRSRVNRFTNIGQQSAWRR